MTHMLDGLVPWMLRVVLQAHKVCPSDPLACNELGVLTYRNQQYSASEQWLLRALELVPGRLHAGKPICYTPALGLSVDGIYPVHAWIHQCVHRRTGQHQCTCSHFLLSNMCQIATIRHANICPPEKLLARCSLKVFVCVLQVGSPCSSTLGIATGSNSDGTMQFRCTSVLWGCVQAKLAPMLHWASPGTSR